MMNQASPSESGKYASVELRCSPEHAPTVVSTSKCPPRNLRFRKMKKTTPLIIRINGAGGEVAPRVPLGGT
jgi:hypothetical protein